MLTTLYRFYDVDDRLLYIGVTSVGPARWAQHEQHKAWWSQVVRSTTEHFPDRPAALAAERAAIAAEHPAYNIIHIHPRNERRPAIMRGHRQGSVFYRSDTDRWVVRSPVPPRSSYYFRTEARARAFLAVLLEIDDHEMRVALRRALDRAA